MKHITEEGEDIAWIAQKYGRRNWKAIYEHDDNKALRQKRPNPHVLQKGDEVVIPPIEPKVHDVETGGDYTFTLPLVKLRLRLYLQDHLGIPYNNKKYRVTIGDDQYESQTDDDGLVDVEVAASASNGELFLITSAADDPEETGHRYILKLAHLDPPKSITGAKARLLNLGYQPGPINPTINDQFLTALRTFQIANDLPCPELEQDATELDDETADAICRIHGN